MHCVKIPTSSLPLFSFETAKHIITGRIIETAKTAA